jgi:hypothetical protein
LCSAHFSGQDSWAAIMFSVEKVISFQFPVFSFQFPAGAAYRVGAMVVGRKIQFGYSNRNC